jgi:4-hydroxy-3-polyprenylbenzoate decarboxylase
VNATRLVVALTGASGAVYGRRMLQVLSGIGIETHFTVSDAARKVASLELGLDLDPANGESLKAALAGAAASTLHYHSCRNLAAPIASGSFVTAGMAIVPCSMGTLARIAAGVSTSLVDRAADVCLKERRRLVLVVRETPYSEIHLENMLRLTRAGAVVLPASPGFYGRASRVEDLVDFVIARTLDHLGVKHDLAPRYGETVAAGHGDSVEDFESWEA